jgi:transcriptional regulator with XRE-family HTH domain
MVYSVDQRADDKMAMPFPAAFGHCRARSVMIPREDILAETGRALRGARQARGMTLRDVGTRSNGRFKPTAVAGYERAERGISLERFCELAELYGMGPERLLLQIMWRLAGGPDPTIQRAKVPELPDEEADVVGGFLQRVRDLRADADDEVITVRVQDLEVLATVSGHQLRDFLDHLEPALASKSDRS